MRKLMWFTIGFGTVCAFGSFCYGDWLLPAVWISLSLAILLAAASVAVKHTRIAAMILAGIAAGALWFSVYDTAYLSSARALDGQVERQTVYIRDYGYQTDYGVAADGDVIIDGKVYRVRVYLDDYTALKPGNRVVGQFRFRFTSSGGANEVLHHRSEGIFLMVYQKGNVVVERFWSTPVAAQIPQWRHQMKDVLEDSFPEDVSGFAKALLLGDSDDIDYETNTAFSVSGIRHIIAVSGLHVSVLFGLINMLTAKRRFLSGLIGIPVLLLFAAAVGFTPSITRAVIMQCLLIVALMLDKEYDPLTGLAFSAQLMFACNPLVVSSVSFLLSFSCMTGILLMSEPMKNWVLDKKRLGKYNSKLLKISTAGIAVCLGATVFTVPLSAVYFETVSLVSIVTNLATLWVITFIFYGILAVCLLGFFAAGAAAWLAGIIAWPMRFVITVAKLMASFPLAAVYTQSRYTVIWLVFAYVLLGVFLLQKRKNTVLFSVICAVTLCVCTLLSWTEPLLDDYRMTMLDVGQGQAILLQSSGKTYLVDCGGDYEEDAADITAQTLLSQGISRLDGIILTHYDRDHSGGLAHLLTRIDTDVILMPYLVDENGVAEDLRALVGAKAVAVRDDLQISYEDTVITVFAPEGYNLGNESSICVLFQSGNCDILITGDRGTAGEHILMREHALPQLDVLVVGHHGSKYSTGTQLLETVRPTYAFISVGEDNSYGHPAEELLERLQEYGCIIYRTDENGTIVYRG